ncbi:hypothetical protein [Xanthomonas fragariae]|uniref:Uncharacterized protein n=1 Tax=Xanthomonas fragariae TaxID=48664 RepID=A0ABY1RTN6_9XANT|nr:hypothetical protein [Xanthomonas fragariae]MEA5185218.1 hypothetical protein [Xanthomonas fragariae]MEA5197200.1 hypothetical protein [Xanthomonas fragariae]SMR00681.1 hypothetical protein PD885_03460 [Xanthomonas fragariae]
MRKALTKACQNRPLAGQGAEAPLRPERRCPLASSVNWLLDRLSAVVPMHLL